MAKNLKTGILITGDSKGAVRALEITGDEVDNLGKKTKKASQAHKDSSSSIIGGFTSMATSAAKWGAAAAATAAAATAAMVKSGLQSVDALAKTSDKLGVATESLAQLRFAAEQTGVETSKFDVALQRFTRRLSDAAAGTGPAVAAFDAMGLSAKELVELKPDEAFAKVADKMNLVENSSQKVSLAFKLFDSGGVGLVNTLALGSEGLADLATEADVLGLTLNRVDAAKVEAANDSMNRISKAVEGFSQHLAIKFAPLLQVVADRMFGIAKESGGMATVATKSFSAMTKAAGAVADVFRGLHAAVLLAGGVLAGAFETMLRGIDAVIYGWTELVNLLPGPDYDFRESKISEYLNAFNGATEFTFGKLHELAMRPMPSDSIQEFTMDVERAYTAQAAAAVETQDIVQGEMIDTERVTKALATTTEKEVKKIETVWDKALTGTIERIDTAFADAWKGAFDSFSDFADGLKASFESLIAELAHMAITRPIIMQIGAAVGLGGASGAASAAGGLSGTGGLLSGISSAGGIAPWLSGGISSAFGGLAGAYEGIGQFAASQGFYGVGGNAYASASQYTGGALSSIGNMGLNLGAGFVGNYAGQQVFGGNTTGIGSGVGGLVGSIWGPVGTAIGSFIGEGLETGLGNLLGFGGGGNNAARSTFTDGGFTSEGLGKNFSEKNLEAVDGLSGAVASFSQIIGGSDFTGQLKVGNKSGIKFKQPGDAEGTEYKDVGEFLAFAFKEVIEGATGLDDTLKNLLLSFEGTNDELVQFSGAIVSLSQQAGINTVTHAIEDFNRVQPTLQQAYSDHAGTLKTLITNFDGSAFAAQELAQTLAINKTAAYEFAIAIQSIGEQIGLIAKDQAAYIRESVLTSEELMQARLAERNALSESLNTLIDPQELEEATRRVLELNRLIFDNLSEDDQLAQAEAFAVYAENTNAVAQGVLQQSLDTLQTTQNDINTQVNTLLQESAARYQVAADTQLEAANRQADAALVLQQAAEAIAFSTNSAEVTP